MECKNCKYNKFSYKESKLTTNGVLPEVKYNYCDISHRVNCKSCDYIKSDSEVKDMKICYNCKDWIGGGDYGLSCSSDYYITNTNGFQTACERFNLFI